MRNARVAGAVAALLVCLGAAPESQSFDQVERGRYLTTVGDCVACHTEEGGKPFAGGRPIETPFGTIVSPNITPDAETGIGRWSDEDFVRMMQRGIGRDGTHIYPAMPYPYTTHVTRSDDLAIRAFLATLPPVRHTVTVNLLPFPLDVRASLAVWNALFFTPGPFKPDPKESAAWNRGAYLVTGLGHCGACHTAKNLAGADEMSEALGGAVLQGWYAPNITGDARRGLGRWSEDEVVEYLRTGHNRWSAASGPMAEEVMLSSGRMTDEDLHAIATYLKSLPGGDEPASARAPDAVVLKAGGAIYADECSACHTPNGAGVAGLFPVLAQSPAVQSRRATTLIRVVLQGAKSAATDAAPTAPAMPAFGWMLSDAQVAAVVGYVRAAWGNDASGVTASDVAAARASLAKRSD